MCNTSCNECCNKVFSNSITIETIDTVATLVVNIPEQTFCNGQRGCIVLVQNIPTAATIEMPVVITIGDGTVNYPVVGCDCNPVVVPMLRTRRRYPFKVVTNTTSGVFKILKNLSCASVNNLTTIGG